MVFSHWTDMKGTVDDGSNTPVLAEIDAFSEWTAMEEVPPTILTGNPSLDYNTGSGATAIASSLTVSSGADLDAATISITPVITEDVMIASNGSASLSSGSAAPV